jgi:hypothetical protein
VNGSSQRQLPVISRRRFVFVGLAGALTLVAARAWQPAADNGNRALTADAADVVRSLIPAFLDGALPANEPEQRDAIERTLTNVEAAIAGLPPTSRNELSTLFSLLSIAPMRLVFAGIDGGWANASREDVDVFLARLKNSRLSMKRAAYDALHQLIMAAWYADPRTWASIGYPGPPRLA